MAPLLSIARSFCCAPFFLREIVPMWTLREGGPEGQNAVRETEGTGRAMEEGRGRRSNYLSRRAPARSVYVWPSCQIVQETFDTLSRTSYDV